MMSTRKHSPGRGSARIRFSLIVAAIATALVAVLPAGQATAKTPSDFFGIFAEGPSAGEFKDMGDAGFGSYRVPINWAAIQKKEKGGFDFSQSDAGVGQAALNGMRPIVVVYGTPRFVHKPSSKGLYGPTSKSELNAWERFTKALAERYGPGGTYFEVHTELDNLPVKKWVMWNEQNSRNNWLPKADPGEYAKLVKSGARGITKVDQKADIILGGMYGYPRDSASMKAKKFLEKLYRTKGFAKHFDAVNSHPYGPDVKSVKKQIGELRNAAKRAGDGNVDLYVGELGWASNGPKKSESVVGRKGQAKRLEDGLRLLAKKRNAWNVLGVSVYVWKDFAAGQLACQWCPGAGLVEKNGKAKPALKAVKRIIR